MAIDGHPNSNKDSLHKNLKFDLGSFSDRTPRRKANPSKINSEHPLKRSSRHFDLDINTFNPKISSDSASLLARDPLIYDSIDFFPITIDPFSNYTPKPPIFSVEDSYIFNKNAPYESSFIKSGSNSAGSSINIIPNSLIADSEVFRNDDFDVFNPHWDDMITFRESRLKIKKRRTWSISHSLISEEPQKNSPSNFLSSKIENPFFRFTIIALLPISVTLAWVSVPIPSRLKPSDYNPLSYQSNFWFFLFFYYGVYNICALMLVTHIFHLYSLNWWPESMSAASANITSWVFSMSIGASLYIYDVRLLHNPLVWTGITLVTLLFPLIISFVQIRRHYSTTTIRQNAGQNPEETIFSHSLEWRVPSSYLRFLWFTGIFVNWYIALIAGEYLAYRWCFWMGYFHKNKILAFAKFICEIEKSQPVFDPSIRLLIVDSPVHPFAYEQVHLPIS
ncbi:hypothetical protein AYI68_g1213 [Smittium mucronatum]|uniref:Uncharacterized protein n=1 Tax=Smittium mucronatum TaxID=133383 RepID=A0A1R0H650_9FUNG|nr:hypothetical protein AYI68_g1213 [Smittium mucronatum]